MIKLPLMGNSALFCKAGKADNGVDVGTGIGVAELVGISVGVKDGDVVWAGKGV
jgi:hypothetical protein